MTLHLASGFILGCAIACIIAFIGMEIGKVEVARERDENYIFNLLEDGMEKDKLIDELVKENKAYKKSWDNWNEERNADYWG